MHHEATVLHDGDFAGWADYKVWVTPAGAIWMDRFGNGPSPEEAEAVGIALIKAAALARARQVVNPSERALRNTSIRGRIGQPRPAGQPPAA